MPSKRFGLVACTLPFTLFKRNHMNGLHLTTSQIHAFAQSGNPVTEEVRNQRDHIVACEQCQEELANTPEFQQLNQSLAWELFAPHLSFEDKCAYLNGTLNDTRQLSVERHLKLCAWCSARVDSLQNIDQEFTERMQDDLRFTQPLLLPTRNPYRFHDMFRRRLVP